MPPARGGRKINDCYAVGLYIRDRNILRKNQLHFGICMNYVGFFVVNRWGG